MQKKATTTQERITIIMLVMALTLPLTNRCVAQVKVPTEDELSKLSVRDRLKMAADVSCELAAKAQSASPELFNSLGLMKEELIPSRNKVYDFENSPIFPMTEHIKQYESVRSWSTQYAQGIMLYSLSPWAVQSWPSIKCAPALRKLLHDTNPQIRSLAAESLATLHQPQDIPLIANLLDDSSKGVAWLGCNMPGSVILKPGVSIYKEINKVEVLRSWNEMRVRDHASHALELMTGQKLDSANFAVWWNKNKDARNKIWYWVQRINSDLNVIEQAYRHEAVVQFPFSDYEYKNAKARYETSRRGALKKVLIDLKKQSSEIEAKVMLLADVRSKDNFSGVRGFTDNNEHPFTDSDIATLRINRSHLLNLMDRKDLWQDVDWESCYKPFVQRLALASDKLFHPEDVGRLRAVLDREFSEYGCYQLEIGISRLLPSAKGDLDAPGTKDGTLRAAINRLNKSQLRVTSYVERGFLAAELVRVGLPGNWKFLKEMFFSEPEDNSFPRLHSILKALGETPLTPAKRDALVDLALDGRDGSIWMRPGNHTNFYRELAAQSLNAHARRELITQKDLTDLKNETTSKQALETINSKIRDWAQK